MTISSPTRWSDVTAVFGGTFDPPHLGHAAAIAGLYSNPGVKRVVVIPSALPPHKGSTATAAQRAEMTRLCMASVHDGLVTVDLREIERHARTGAPSYSYDTLRELSVQAGPLAFVIGADQLTSLDRWHRFPDLLGLCHWIVLARKPIGDEIAGRTLRDWMSSGLAREGASSREWVLGPSQGARRTLLLCDTDAPELSSTRIREEIARTGQIPQNTLSEPVSRYLKEHHLYGT